MNKTVPLVDADSVCSASEDQRRESPAFLLNRNAGMASLTDAALTRLSRVVSVLRTLKRRDDDLTDSVTFGHLAGMLDEVSHLVETIQAQQGGQS